MNYSSPTPEAWGKELEQQEIGINQAIEDVCGTLDSSHILGNTNQIIEDLNHSLKHSIPTTEDFYLIADDFHKVIEDIQPIIGDRQPIEEGFYNIADDLYKVIEDIHPITGGIHPIEDDEHKVIDESHDQTTEQDKRIKTCNDATIDYLFQQETDLCQTEEDIVEISSTENEDNEECIVPVVSKYPRGNLKQWQHTFDLPKKMIIRKTIFYSEDLERLLPNRWLNDKLINFYLEMLSETFTSTYYFNTFTYEMIRSRIPNQQLKDRFNNVDFSKYKYFIFPIHTSSHWSIVKVQRQRIIGFDSLGSVPNNILESIGRFYRDVILAPEGEPQESDLPFIWYNHQRKYPKQSNGDDCGAFCCAYAKYYATINDFTQFSPEDIELFRAEMLHEILAGKIMYY